MKRLVLVLSFPVFCLSATAHAHFNLDAPPPSTTTTDGGMGSPPCGVGTPSGIVTAAQGGHALTIKIDEFVAHTGFYRIALALDSVSELPLDPVVKNAMGSILPPSGKPAGTSATADFSDTPAFPVLADHLFQHNGTGAQKFQMDITLPNVNCDKCTLQVLEFMAGHGFNAATPPDTGPGGGYFYRHCADLKITADPALPLQGSAGAAGMSTGGTSSSAGGSASGGAPSSGGGAGGASGTGSPSLGGASTGGAAAVGGTGVTGAAGAAAATTPDAGGCSVSVRRGGAPALAFVALLAGALLGLARRRRASKSQA